MVVLLDQFHRKTLHCVYIMLLQNCIYIVSTFHKSYAICYGVVGPCNFGKFL